MPQFQIGLDDGRTLRIDADTQEAALAGAQHFMDNAGPRTNAAGAAAEGFLNTAGMGWRDEARGLAAASDLPETIGGVPLGGIRSIGGAINLGLEKYRGGDEYSKRYQEERDFTRQVQKASQEEHPNAYMGGEVGGAVAGALTLPAFKAAQGAGWVARAGAAAKTGALYGGLYGAGESEGGLADALGKGAIGAATGAGIGAVASPAADIAAHGVGYLAGKGGEIYQFLRSEANPRFVNQEAERRVAEAIAADRRAGQAPLTPEDVDMARRAGIPLVAGDYGGPNTTSLMRSAVNTSPEARGAVEGFTKGFAGFPGVGENRFGGQNERAANFIRDLTGGANATQDLEGIKAAARQANMPAYERAYKAGDRPIWSPELERLVSASPSIRQAMKTATISGQDRAAEEGFGAFNSPVTVTPDGQLKFNRTPSGGTTYPNLQFWDYVQRDLNDLAEKVAGREPDKFRYLNGLHQQLNNELDRIVPQYQRARLGAWRSFQSQDALEAGQKFAGLTGKNSDYARDIATMTPDDRQLFARGYAAELSDKLLKLRDANSIDRAFLTSKNAIERHNMALGPDRARQLEAYLRVEQIADRMRVELGNSTTARQHHEIGLAGAGIGGEVAGELLGGHGAIGGAIGLASHFVRHKMTATEQAVSRRVGQLLVSDDPRTATRAIQAVSRSPGLMDALRRASRQDLPMTAARAATVGTQSQVQGPAANAIGGPNQ